MPFNANEFRRARNELGLSSYDFARELGCTPQSILNWENDRFGPTSRTIDKMWEIFAKHGKPEVELYVHPRPDDWRRDQQEGGDGAPWPDRLSRRLDR